MSGVDRDQWADLHAELDPTDIGLERFGCILIEVF
jgi:hypothetical protein